MSYLLQAKCFIRSIPWKMFYSWFLEKCDTYANNPPPCSHACYHNAANIVSNPIPKSRCKNHFCSASGNWEMAEWDRPFICSIGSVQWYLVRPPSPIMSPIYVTKTGSSFCEPVGKQIRRSGFKIFGQKILSRYLILKHIQWIAVEKINWVKKLPNITSSRKCLKLVVSNLVLM